MRWNFLFCPGSSKFVVSKVLCMSVCCVRLAVTSILLGNGYTDAGSGIIYVEFMSDCHTRNRWWGWCCNFFREYPCEISKISIIVYRKRLDFTICCREREVKAGKCKNPLSETTKNPLLETMTHTTTNPRKTSSPSHIWSKLQTLWYYTF